MLVKSMNTYILALYDENLKPRPASECAYGLFKPDHTMTYDVCLSKIRQTPSTAVSSSFKPPTIVVWCVPKAGVFLCTGKS
jgi:hypothetical protein